MAHLKLAVFSNSAVDAEKVAANHMFVPQTHTNWYAVKDSPDDSVLGEKLQAFITADGELIEFDKLLWLDLAQTKSDCLLVFNSILRAYFYEAKKTNLLISLVDCRI